jgi:hypothetical protein
MTRHLRTLVTACALTVLVGIATAARAADNSVAAARELYASAAYDDALKMLDELYAGSHTREEGRAIGLYRILCLVAVGRVADADQALETLITHDPLFRPAMDDLSPRMRTAVIDTRKRLLPGIVQQRYRDAKAAYDRQEFAIAAEAFAYVLDTLADPEIADAAGQPPLSDLKVLAVGFRDLSEKAAAPPPPPPPPPAPVVVEAPPPAPTRDYLRLYSSADADVVPAVPIRQSFPRFSGRLTAAASGIIDLIIDATGAVEKATLRVPVDPRYDNQLMNAVERWQYKPATVDGVPVKFMKSVQVNLTPDRE